MMFRYSFHLAAEADAIESAVDKALADGWRTADKKPVKNGELWQELDRLVSQHQIDWRWVKGHAGNPGNEKADALANLGVEAARGERPEKLS